MSMFRHAILACGLLAAGMAATHAASPGDPAALA